MKKLPLLLFLLTSSILNAQPQFKKNNVSNNVSKGLSIGDVVPDVTLVNLLNYPTITAKLSDFKGKLIIIDFWNKWCSSCIAYFPKMEKMQESFSNKIQVLLVTNNTTEELKSLFEKSPIVKSTTLPFVIGDSILNNFFPHTSVPYHVWIDESGIVRELTSAESTTHGNVQAFLDKRNIALPVRVDKNVIGISLLGSEVDKERLVSYSIVTGNNKFTRQNSVEAIQSKSAEIIGYRYINTPIISIFNILNGGNLKTIVEAKGSENTEKYFWPKNPDKLSMWTENNTYCYEVVFPPQLNRKKWNDFMLHDLENHFSIKSTVEVRKMKCLILYSTGTKEKSYGKNILNGFVTCEKTKENIWVLRNCPISAIENKILTEYSGNNLSSDAIPVINESNATGMINADIKVGGTLRELDKELRRYGFGIKEEIRDVNCLIIREL